MSNAKKLYKDTKNKSICGVCSGLAKYLSLDVTVVRLVAVLLCLFVGGGLIAYIIAALVIPEEPADNIVDGCVQDKNTME